MSLLLLGLSAVLWSALFAQVAHARGWQVWSAALVGLLAGPLALALLLRPDSAPGRPPRAAQGSS